jgi:hypothetical protein
MFLYQLPLLVSILLPAFGLRCRILHRQKDSSVTTLLNALPPVGSAFPVTSIPIKELKIQSTDGIELSVLYSEAILSLQKAPVVFIHGSFHSGWCWAEEFMPAFNSRGISN